MNEFIQTGIGDLLGDCFNEAYSKERNFPIEFDPQRWAVAFVGDEKRMEFDFSFLKDIHTYPKSLAYMQIAEIMGIVDSKAELDDINYSWVCCCAGRECVVEQYGKDLADMLIETFGEGCITYNWVADAGLYVRVCDNEEVFIGDADREWVINDIITVLHKYIDKAENEGRDVAELQKRLEAMEEFRDDMANFEKITVAGEVNVDFPIRINAEDAKDIVVDKKVDELALRAYLLATGLGDTNSPFSDRRALPFLKDYIEERECKNGYSFNGCRTMVAGDDGSVVLNIGLCYNYGGTMSLPIYNKVGVALCDVMRDRAEIFAHRIGASSYKDTHIPTASEVAYTTVEWGEKTFEFADELELENTLFYVLSTGIDTVGRQGHRPIENCEPER